MPNFISNVSNVGAKTYGKSASGDPVFFNNSAPSGRAPIKLASMSDADAIEYTINTGDPTVTVDVSPTGLPCLKIVCTEYTELILPQMVGQKYNGHAFMAVYGSQSLTDIGTVEMRLYEGGGTSDYKRGRWFQSSGDPVNGYPEQGGNLVYHFNKNNTLDVGAVSSTFDITQAKIIINPSTAPCTLYLFAIGVGIPKKSRICVVYDDAYRSALTLGVEPFLVRNIPLTTAVIASLVGTSAIYADIDMLKTFVDAGNACVAHGPIPTSGSLISNYTDPETRVNSAITDILYNVNFLRQNDLLIPLADACYIWPQGQFQWETADTTLLDAAIENGIVLSRTASSIGASDAGYCVSLDAASKYQRLAAPILGHAFAGTTATEATNIAAIVANIQNIGASYGQDAYLMLHKVVPTATVDGSIDSISIRVSDINTIATAIKTEVDAGRMEAVSMPSLVSDQSYWNKF